MKVAQPLVAWSTMNRANANEGDPVGTSKGQSAGVPVLPYTRPDQSPVCFSAAN
jgi:hypothetical protein